MIPAPEKVFNELNDVLCKINVALEYGTEKAREFFETLEFEEKVTMDPFLAPHLVRYHAKKILEKMGHVITEDEGNVNLENIPNNGLSLNIGKYKLRILKSNDGGLPAPGHSQKRQHYYHQLPLELFHTGADSQKTNLILLWEVNSEFRLGRLSLGCPRTGGLTRESVTAYWICRVPDEIFVHGTEITSMPSVYIEDIPLTPKMNKKTWSIDSND